MAEVYPQLLRSNHGADKDYGRDPGRPDCTPIAVFSPVPGRADPGWFGIKVFEELSCRYDLHYLETAFCGRSFGGII